MKEMAEEKVPPRALPVDMERRALLVEVEIADKRELASPVPTSMDSLPPGSAIL